MTNVTDLGGVAERDQVLSRTHYISSNSLKKTARGLASSSKKLKARYNRIMKYINKFLDQLWHGWLRAN